MFCNNFTSRDPEVWCPTDNFWHCMAMEEVNSVWACSGGDTQAALVVLKCFSGLYPAGSGDERNKPRLDEGTLTESLFRGPQTPCKNKYPFCVLFFEDITSAFFSRATV